MTNDPMTNAELITKFKMSTHHLNYTVFIGDCIGSGYWYNMDNKIERHDK